MNKSSPVLQALVLADHIYTDEGSSKRIICGTFSKISCLSFPAIYNQTTWVFVLLVDVTGEINLQFRFVSLANDEILMQSSPIKIQALDKLTPLDIAIQIPPFPLPRAGIYSFECYADGTMIGSVRLNVELLKQEERNG